MRDVVAVGVRSRADVDCSVLGVVSDAVGHVRELFAG